MELLLDLLLPVGGLLSQIITVCGERFSRMKW
jgi:hypothetical protein